MDASAPSPMDPSAALFASRAVACVREESQTLAEIWAGIGLEVGGWMDGWWVSGLV